MTETSKERKIRTNKQNKYLWGVVYPTIAKALAERGVRTEKGNRITEDHVHYYCKRKFLLSDAMTLSPDISPVWRESIPSSTSTLTTEEFDEYKMSIQQVFAREGIDIPDPNEEAMMGVYGKKIKGDCNG